MLLCQETSGILNTDAPRRLRCILDRHPLAIPVLLAGHGKFDDPHRNKLRHLVSRAGGELKPGTGDVKRPVHGLDMLRLESEGTGRGGSHRFLGMRAGTRCAAADVCKVRPEAAPRSQQVCDTRRVRPLSKCLRLAHDGSSRRRPRPAHLHDPARRFEPIDLADNAAVRDIAAGASFAEGYELSASLPRHGPKAGLVRIILSIGYGLVGWGR
jgi:hypothetical protein